MLDLNLIDEPIRDVVETMNKLGFRTTDSCAGYSYKGHTWRETGGEMRPYITFHCSLKQARIFCVCLESTGHNWYVALCRGGFLLDFPYDSTNAIRRASWDSVRVGLVRYHRRLKRTRKRK